MSSGRQVFFTKVDEAAISAALIEKFPGVIFAEGGPWSSPILPIVPSIDAATGLFVYVFVPDNDWKPRFKKDHRDTKYFLENPTGLEIIFFRSSNGWTANDLTDEGEPRWITEGSFQICYEPHATKAQISFRNKVWRIFPKIATWRLKAYSTDTRQPLDWEKTDKVVWAGHDAIRWVRKNKLRFLQGSLLYRPKESAGSKGAPT